MKQGREGWDVAVACDIRLGERFRNDPELMGTQLHIDLPAIEQTIRSLPGYKPQLVPLLVTVKHEETMETDDAMGHFYASRGDKIVEYRPDLLHVDISLGNFTAHQKQQSRTGTKLPKLLLRTTDDSDVFIRSAIGDIVHLTQEQSGTPVDITDRAEQAQTARQLGRTAARSLGCFIMPEEDRGKVETDKPVTISKGSLVFSHDLLQETTVHELQHAVDKMNPSPSDTWQQRKILARLYGWRIVSTLGVLVSSQVAYEGVEKVAFDTLSPGADLLSTIAGSIIAIAATSKFATFIGNTRRLDDRYSELSIWEQRAEAAEEIASEFPQMVSIVKKRQEAITPVTIR